MLAIHSGKEPTKCPACEPRKTDIFIKCQDCTRNFKHSVYGQDLYERLGKDHPTRCRDCTIRHNNFIYTIDKVNERFHRIMTTPPPTECKWIKCKCCSYYLFKLSVNDQERAIYTGVEPTICPKCKPRKNVKNEKTAADVRSLLYGAREACM